MATVKISQLPAAAPLAGDELVPIEQEGVTVATTPSAIAGLGAQGTVTEVDTAGGLIGGPITTTGTIEIQNTGVLAGTYGDEITSITLTVNARGQITSISQAAIEWLVPPGGTTGQFLKKASNNDGDTDWGGLPGTGTVTQVDVGAGLTATPDPITTTGEISVATNGITDGMLRQSAARSVIGRSAATSGDVADITASADDQVLVRVTGTLGFAQLTATQVVNTPAGGISATTVQGALNELDTEKASLSGAAFTGAVSITGAAAGLFAVTQVDDTAAAGPIIELTRSSASPAASDILASLRFWGKDSANATTIYSQIRTIIIDPTDGSEDGALDFVTTVAGTTSSRFYIGAGIYSNGVTGGDKGAGQANFQAIYEQNNRVKTVLGGVFTGGLYSNGVTGGDKGAGTLNFATIYQNDVPVMTTGGGTFTSPVSITGTNASPLTISYSDDGATSGPNFDVYRVSASPAASDVIGAVRFYGRDSGGNDTIYGNIRSIIFDPTDGSEDGVLDFVTTIAGTGASRFQIGNGLYGTSTTGGDKGAGSANFTTLYQNNVQVMTLAGGTFTGNLTISKSTPLIDLVDSGATARVGGSSSGSLVLSADPAGTAASSVILFNVDGTSRGYFGNGLVVGVPTGTDKGTGTINAAGTIYQNNVAVALTDTVYSGTYTPTFTGVANIDSITAYVSQYMRVGNVVTVSLYCVVDATAGGSTLTQFRVSLPVASNFTAVEQLSGTMSIASSISGAIRADITNDTGDAYYFSGSTAALTCNIVFTYRII